jgi:hypothetical protein
VNAYSGWAGSIVVLGVDASRGQPGWELDAAGHERARVIETPKGECPPRSGSVQRDGIRQAGIGPGEATARTGPPDTNFFISVPIRSVPFSVPVPPPFPFPEKTQSPCD